MTKKISVELSACGRFFEVDTGTGRILSIPHDEIQSFLLKRLRDTAPISYAAPKQLFPYNYKNTFKKNEEGEWQFAGRVQRYDESGKEEFSLEDLGLCRLGVNQFFR